MITEIDKNTALVLIDLQKGILKMNISNINEVLEKVAILVEAFRKAGLPIVPVNVIPSSSMKNSRKDISNANNPAFKAAAASPDYSEIVDQIKTQPTDLFITKHTWNAFFDTKLHDELHKLNITGLVLAGVSTSAGVEGTARSASELGYNISFATDAMTDLNPEAHLNSIKIIFPKLGEVGTTNDILEKIQTM